MVFAHALNTSTGSNAYKCERLLFFYVLLAFPFRRSGQKKQTEKKITWNWIKKMSGKSSFELKKNIFVGFLTSALTIRTQMSDELQYFLVLLLNYMKMSTYTRPHTHIQRVGYY